VKEKSWQNFEKGLGNLRHNTLPCCIRKVNANNHFHCIVIAVFASPIVNVHVIGVGLQF